MKIFLMQCQDTLVQFGSFLSMQLSTEEFIKRLPPINELIGVYHVPQDAAFFLCRPLYSYRVNVSIYHNHILSIFCNSFLIWFNSFLL